MGKRPDTSTFATDQKPPTPRNKWHKRFKGFVVLICILPIFMLIMGIGAEYYTSRPEFCGSCHIMQPYYKNWKNDVHFDKGKALCVDCHYAPGQQHTFKAKFKGLSQLTSYFSGRAGAGRPKPHVDDASCLTSDCHEDRKYITKKLQIGNVEFSHAKHLDNEKELYLDNQKKLTEIRAKISARLNPEQFAAVEKIARSALDPQLREQQLSTYLAHNGLQEAFEEVSVFAELLHMEVRIDQLAGLHCASCHQFNAGQEKHFAVAKTTCYTCHFSNQHFNANTGRCLGCHEPPTKPILAHHGSSLNSKYDSAPASEEVTMDHATLVANDVKCEACHADLIHGDGEVTRRDCENCHDQARYLKDFEEKTTEVVRDYHKIHAARQHARCNDCHELIDHELLQLTSLDKAEELLTPIRQECEHCHPKHHQEQIEMLLGKGGSTTGESVVNVMAGSRMSCRGCHTQRAEDLKGDALLTATAESCRICHSEEYMELLGRWRRNIEIRLTESQSLLANLKKRSATTKPSSSVADDSQIQSLIARAQLNIELVAKANGIHNKNYALILLDQADADLQELSKLLK